MTDTTRKSVVISTSVGEAPDGRRLILFPSRWTAGSVTKSKPFAFYPYELAYLSSLLKRDLPQDRYRVKMIDPNLLGMSVEETKAWLDDLRPDYLVMEPSAVDSPLIFQIFDYCRSRYATRCIAVGAYARSASELCARHADVVVPGEYEVIVRDVLLADQQGADAKVVPGVYPTPRSELIDPNILPWPEDDDVSRIDYTEPGCDGRMIQLYASRGCPLACSFCVVPSYYGDRARTWRPRDPADVAAEIAALDQKYHGLFSGIFFNEEAHNSDKEWVAELCRQLIARNLTHLRYDAMCLYYNFDDELLGLMKQAGYHQIRFGIESFDADVGRSIRKNVRYDQLTQVLKLAKKHGMITYGTTMVGAPGSSFESDLETHNLLCHLRNDLELLEKWQVSIATPQPGTPFHNQVTANQELLTDDLSHYNGRQAVASFKNYSADEIETMYAIFTKRQPVTLEDARNLAAARKSAAQAGGR